MERHWSRVLGDAFIACSVGVIELAEVRFVYSSEPMCLWNVTGPTCWVTPS
jgi:hypothetical protein